MGKGKDEDKKDRDRENDRGGRETDVTREIEHDKTKTKQKLCGKQANTQYIHVFDVTNKTAFLMAEWKTTPASFNVVAPSGFGYYDAFHNLPDSAMTHMSIGPATPMNAKCFARCDNIWKMNVQKGSR